MPNLGLPEILIVLVVVLVIFGPKRLPGLGKSLGTGMREFKDSISGTNSRRDDDDDAPALASRNEHESHDEGASPAPSVPASGVASPADEVSTKPRA